MIPEERCWDGVESALLSRFLTPRDVQDFLDGLAYNTDEVCRCPREVMRTRKAHCMDGALFAAAALERLGYPPLLLDLRAVNDDDHVIALFRERGLWGAVAKSNTTLLRYRDPVYRTLRELALSYFPAYFNLNAEMSLRSYSGSFTLERYPGWQFSQELMDAISEDLDLAKHYPLLPEEVARSLPKAPKYLVDACFFGADPEGLFKPE